MLQYSCLANPMDGGAWQAAVHGVVKSRTRLSNFPFTFHFLHWRRKWQPTPVFLPGESQVQGSLVGCRLRGHTESNTIEATQQQQQQQPFQDSYVFTVKEWRCQDQWRYIYRKLQITVAVTYRGLFFFFVKQVQKQGAQSQYTGSTAIRNSDSLYPLFYQPQYLLVQILFASHCIAFQEVRRKNGMYYVSVFFSRSFPRCPTQTYSLTFHQAT